MALTALRLKGAKYKEARRYVANAWVPCNHKFVRRILSTLLGMGKNNEQQWRKLLKQSPNLNKCLDLLFNYAAKVRNQIFHGNYYPFAEKEENLIFDIYVRTIEEIERIIAKKKNGNRILRNSPTEFGAPKGQLDRIGQLKNIIRFKNANKGYPYEKAKSIFEQLR